MKKKKKNKWIYNIILVIAVAVFLYSVYQLAHIYAEYRKGDKEYENIVKQTVDIGTVQEEMGESEQHQSLKIDFAELCKRNSETVAWIQFDRPEKINYPIVQAGDNDKYLKTTFDGKQNSLGAIFMDANGAIDFYDRNTFIYGHNMKNGSMFGQLRKYKAKEYCAENPYFYIYTIDGREIKYQIFAVCVVEDVSRSYTNWFEDDAQFMDYLKYIKGIALYDVNTELNEQSKIVSLSTCTNVTDTQRLLIHGVKISEK